MSKRNNIFLVAKIFLAVLLCILAVTMVISCGDDEETGCDGKHTWDGGKVNAATCTADGSKVFTCTKCGEKKTEVIKASHDYKETVTPATCTIDGHVTRACTKCGDSTSTVIKASHNYTQTVIEATCTRDGAIVNSCSGCGDEYRSVTQRAKGHNTVGVKWTSTEVQIEGCNWQHVETANCVSCGEEVSHSSDYVKHNFYVTISQTATCSTPGTKTKTCNDCGETETEEYTDANAHTYGEGVVNANVTTYTCANGCGNTKTTYSAKEEISAEVPSDALQSAGEVELLNASVKLDQSVLDQLKGANVTISAETLEDALLDAILDKMSDDDKAKLGSGAIFNFSLTQNGDLVGEFEGKVTVTVPFVLEDGMDPDNIAVWYIDENGNPDYYEAVYCEINGEGFAKFETTHFSYYTVIRVSPEKRCELYGHKYETTVVPAACNEQGYTMDVCKMCKDIKRYDFTDALTHNYTKTVTPATCAKRGYTTYACELCRDKYISDYVDVTAHTFVSSVVPAKCNEKGYTLEKCSVCGYSVQTNPVAPLGHTYQNGACVTCGKVATAAGNTFLVMIDSVANASSYLLQSSGLSMVMVRQPEEGQGITVKYIIETLKATISIDDSGYFSGKGEAVISMENSMDMSEMNGKVNSIIVFENGMLYLYANTSAGIAGEEASKLIACVDQDFFLENMFGPASDVVTGFDPSMLEAYLPIWEAIINKDKNPINTVLARIIGFAFTQKETADGYTYIFNPTIATMMYNSLKTDSVSVIFDKIFGENAFDNTVAFLKEALPMTFAELEAEGANKLEKLGINLSDIFSVPEEMKDAVVFDYVMAMMEEMGGNREEMPKPEDGMGSAEDKLEAKPMNSTGETEEEPMPTLDDVIAMIDEYATMLKEATIFDMLGASEIPEGEDPYIALIQSIVESFSKANLQFKTNKDGEFISSSANFTGFSYTLDMMGMSATISLDGNISFSINETYSTDYSDVINQAGAIKDSVKPDSVIDLGQYYIIYVDGNTFIWSNVNYAYGDNINMEYRTLLNDATLVGDDTYNGIACKKYQGSVVHLYLVDDNFLNGGVDCIDWYITEVELDSNGAGIDATVWVDANDRVVGLEIDSEMVNEQYFNQYGRVRFYFNATTKEYKAETLHNYKLVQTIKPNGCEYGKRIYECTVCGNAKTEEFGEGHSWTYKAVLNPGATSCEDGATATRYCTKCNMVSGTYEVDYHETFRQSHVVESDSACGNLTVFYSSCACGQRQYFDHVESDHIFDRRETDVDGEYITTFVCAINNCGYSYTFKENNKYNYYPEREETCWYEQQRVYNFGNGEFILNINDTWVSHPLRYESTENGHINTCENCGRQIYEYRYDSYGREIYFYDFIQEYGWTREFSGCNYVQYYINSDEEPNYGTSHMINHVYSDSSCSQYRYVSRSCEICGETFESYYESPNTWGPDWETHNWYFDGELQVFVCYRCGTKSALGADGLITLEDMTKKGSFTVGYFNKGEYKMDSEVYYNIVLNYDEEGGGLEVENSESYMEIVDTTPTDRYYSRESGIINIDEEALKSYILGLDEEVETVSLVCWVLNVSDYNYDEEGNPIESWIAHAITLDISEFNALCK